MYGKWIKESRLAADMSQEQLSKKIKVSKQNISSWENEHHVPNMGDILKIAVATKAVMPNDIQDYVERAIKVSGDDNALLVPLLRNTAEMGSGATELENDVIDGKLRLSQAFANRIGIRPSAKLCFITAIGDSMSPTISASDIVLVDTSVSVIDVDGIFVLRTNGRLFIKRVRQRLSGEFEVSSDNTNHSTADVLDGTEGIDVVGRVIYAWHGQQL